MQNNPLENSPMAFFAGLVLAFVGAAGAVFYLFVRTTSESLIMPGPTFRLKHFVLALVVLAAGAALASFARPRGLSASDSTSYNRLAERYNVAQIGYAAMLEQFHPKDLLGFCVQAEAAGFSGVMAADHVQPWVPQQGQAGFVWSFMTAAAERTCGDIGPGVTCLSFRSHPSIIAHAAD